MRLFLCKRSKFKTCWLYCHRTLRLTSPLRAVEFGFLFHSSYASTFSLVVLLGLRPESIWRRFQLYPPPACFPSRPSPCQTPTKFDDVPESYDWKKHIRPLSVGPLILLHPVSTGPRRIIPFTSSNRKCIHYEPNALGSQSLFDSAERSRLYPWFFREVLAGFLIVSAVLFFITMLWFSRLFFTSFFPPLFPSKLARLGVHLALASGRLERRVWMQVSLVTGCIYKHNGLEKCICSNIVGHSTLCNYFPVWFVVLPHNGC